MTLPPVLATTWVVIEYLIKIAALGTVPENRRPSSSTAWLLLIFLLPLWWGRDGVLMAQPATVLLLTPPLCWLLWREWRALSPAGGRASVPMQRALTAP